MKYEGNFLLKHETDKAFLIGRRYWVKIELFDEHGKSFQIDEQDKMMDMWLPKSQSKVVRVMEAIDIDSATIQVSLWLYNKMHSYLKERCNELQEASPS